MEDIWPSTLLFAKGVLSQLENEVLEDNSSLILKLSGVIKAHEER